MSEEIAYADYNIAEIARLRQQLTAAECAYALAAAENATLRDAHTAVLACLDVRGPLLPTVCADELREALHG